MKKNFTWTIVSCVAVMLVAVSLYVNKMTSKVHLTSEQLKDMGLYLICLLYTSPSPRDRG